VQSWRLEKEIEQPMSTATITEPSIETSTATDRLTEALEQKLSKARNERVAGTKVSEKLRG
jgi:hypothetical protein